MLYLHNLYSLFNAEFVQELIFASRSQLVKYWHCGLGQLPSQSVTVWQVGQIVLGDTRNPDHVEGAVFIPPCFLLSGLSGEAFRCCLFEEY